jgi:hypothetical protein
MRGEPGPAEASRPVDPDNVHTLAELKQALNHLRGVRSYAALNG